jgi:hypothetical protein
MAIIYIRNVLNPELSVYWSIFIEEILNNKFELIYKDWSKLFVRFIRNDLNQVVRTLA